MDDQGKKQVALLCDQSPTYAAGYAAGIEIGREAGMREAAQKLKERDERAYQNIKDFAEQEKVPMSENEYLLGRGDEAHGAYMAIISAMGK